MGGTTPTVARLARVAANLAGKVLEVSDDDTKLYPKLVY